MLSHGETLLWYNFSIIITYYPRGDSVNKSNQEKLNQKKIKREIQQYNPKGETRKSEPDPQHPF